MGDVLNLLERPMYSFAQVDGLLGLRSPTARRWIDGYSRAGKWYEPVIREQSTGNQLATWGEFVECRLLSEYRHVGVPMVNMRPVVQRLRSELEVQYPLASAQMWLEPHGKELVFHVQGNSRLDKKLWVVRTGQYELDFEWTPPAERFINAAKWDDERTELLSLRMPGDLVEINPRMGFGDPVLVGRNVRTDVIGELVRAGEPVWWIAETYGLTEEQVNAAAAYEQRIRRAA